MDFDQFINKYGYRDLANNLDYKNQIIYPKYDSIFRSFSLTPYKKVRVVVFGQDPYHTKGCANGLAFSVPRGVRIPPSLKNIFKELLSDLGIRRADSDLSDWANQGVLLLNTALSVEERKPRSHVDKWRNLAKDVIEVLNQKTEPIIFILWGNDAKKNKPFINEKHFIIESAHPSPLSAHHGFWGSKPFSRTNAILESLGKEKINW